MTADIVPVGDIELTVLGEVSSVLREQYGLIAEAATQIPYETLGIDPQPPYDAETLLSGGTQSETDTQTGTDTPTVVITRLSVTHDDRAFVFGVANADSSVCLVSTYRLFQSADDPDGYTDPETAVKRVRKEVVHEVGHVLGLSHCDNDGCAMTFSMQLGDIDAKSESLCAECVSTLTATEEPTV